MIYSVLFQWISEQSDRDEQAKPFAVRVGASVCPVICDASVLIFIAKWVYVCLLESTPSKEIKWAFGPSATRFDSP